MESKSEHNSGQPNFQGRILVSEPLFTDMYFHRSVILVAGHEKEGAFGIIINKPIQNQVNEVLVDFPEFDAPVYLGGPVRSESVFFIHTIPNVDDSLEIVKGLYWGGRFDIIKTLVAEGNVTPDQLRFFLGYSGWSENQLEGEIASESWVLSDLSVDKIMLPDTTRLWKECVMKLGKPYSEWAKYPSDPRMN